MIIIILKIIIIIKIIIVIIIIIIIIITIIIIIITPINSFLLHYTTLRVLKSQPFIAL